MLGVLARRGWLAVGVALLGATGAGACNALLGNEDGSVAPDAATLEGGSVDGSVDADSAVSDGSADTSRLPDGAILTCDASLDTDPTNCGRCGRDCGSGACNAGVCSATALADTIDHPFGIAIAGNGLYFTQPDAGAVVKIDLPGGSPSNLHYSQVDRPSGIASDGANLYWGNDSYPATMYREAAGSTTAIPVAVSEDHPNQVAVDDTNVYWANQGTTKPGIYGCPKGSSCAPSALITFDAGHTYFGVAAGFGHVCWASDMGVQCKAWNFSVTANPLPRQLAIDGATLYVASDGGVFSCPIDACSGFAPVASPSTPAFAITVDGAIYWTDYINGSVMSCPLGGCGGPATLIAATLQNHPRAITTDANFVYWINEGSISPQYGSVWRVAK